MEHNVLLAKTANQAKADKPDLHITPFNNKLLISIQGIADRCQAYEVLLERE